MIGWLGLSSLVLPAHAGWLEPTNEGTMEVFVPDGLEIVRWTNVVAQTPGGGLTASYEKAFAPADAYFRSLKYQLGDFGVRGAKAVGEPVCEEVARVVRCTGAVRGKTDAGKQAWTLVVAEPLDGGAGVAMLLAGAVDDPLARQLLVGFRPAGSRADPVGGTVVDRVGRAGDGDGDGVADAQDQCPREVGDDATGCRRERVLAEGCAAGDGVRCGELAQLRAMAGDVDGAFAADSRACELGNVWSCGEMGLVLLDRGDAAGARPLLQKACAADHYAACDGLEAQRGSPAEVGPQTLTRKLPGPCRVVSMNEDFSGRGDTGDVTHYAWSPEGVLVETATDSGTRVHYTHDDAGRVLTTRRDYPDGGSYELHKRYDAAGNVVEEVSVSGDSRTVIRRRYDADGKLAGVEREVSGDPAPEVVAVVWTGPRQYEERHQDEVDLTVLDDQGRVVRREHRYKGAVVDATVTTYGATETVNVATDRDGIVTTERLEVRDAHGNVLEKKTWMGGREGGILEHWSRYDYGCWGE